MPQPQEDTELENEVKRFQSFIDEWVRYDPWVERKMDVRFATLTVPFDSTTPITLLPACLAKCTWAQHFGVFQGFLLLHFGRLRSVRLLGY